MPKIGIIAEGITDHKVINNILSGYFNNDDVNPKALQPLLDATDYDATKHFGNWYNVFLYFQYNLALVFGSLDYIIVQIDTDRAHEWTPAVNKSNNETVEDFVDRIKLSFIDILNANYTIEFVNAYQSKIIFAIAVNETECWLLPLHCTNAHDVSASNNCIRKLNQNGIAINPNKKDPNLYEKVSSGFSKQRILNRNKNKNPSLKLFIQELDNKILA